MKMVSSREGADYSRLRRMQMILIVLVFMAVAIGAFVMGTLDESLETILLAFVPAICPVVFAFYMATLPCPNCGRRFFISGVFGDPLANKCKHCGV